MKDLKYLAALTIPIAAVLGLYFKGGMTFLTPVYAFVIIPLVEMIMPLDHSNLDREDIAEKKRNPLFDYMLYLNIPVVFGVLLYTTWDISNHNYTITEIIGLVVSTGIVLGTNGINVAHELG
ncbi:MAG: alkane 1-monooxygenase, partial [Eudoraea sp.]|nr:alkane 1-monooxygenase [Eudoraea sp.]